MKPLRLRTTLTAWYSLVLAAILVAFAAMVVWQQGAIGMRRIDRELNGLTATASALLRDELDESDTPQLAAREVVATLAATGRYVAIATELGQELARSPHAPSLQPFISGRDTRAISWSATSADNQWRVAVSPQAIGRDTYLLMAATPLADAGRERREARNAMLLTMPLLLGLAAAGGSWLATIALRPIAQMAGRASALPVDGSTDLGDSGRVDELGRLEEAFNGLVARLREALHTQRQFMADASHELRTPVSVIRSVADVTLDRPSRAEPEYRDALALVRAQTTQATRLLDDMLMLARADSGGYPLQPVHLYLNELVASCCDALGGPAAERKVSLYMAPSVDVPMSGDEELLRRMVLNLLQNAVQHTRTGGRVDVAVSQVDGEAEVRVVDQGFGIAAADRSRIFERFVQLDAARRRSGAGLGLPIARWIAEAHGGRLELTDSSDAGSTFAARLPLGGTG